MLISDIFGRYYVLARLGRISILRQRILLILGCAALFGVWLTWAPLTEIDEARFTEASRQMLAAHTLHGYLIPQFNGEPRYQKPILYYWIQAGSMRLFGVREWAARLPSAVASLLLVLLVHLFLLRWLVPRESPDPARVQAGRGAAFLSAAALATMPMVAIWAHAAVTDPTLTLFITGTLLALLQADLKAATGAAAPRRVRHWYLAAAACAALAFLTKGPVGVVLPALVWIIYHLSRGTLRATARTMPWLGGILLFLLIAAPWYMMVYKIDPQFLRHFFMTENVERFTSTMETHGMANRLWGLLYYLPISLLLLFPASAFLLYDLVTPGDEKSVPLDAGVFPRLRRFGWIWTAGIIGIFSFSRTQLPHYIQAVSGAAALLFALYLLRQTALERVSARCRCWAHAARLTVLALFGAFFVGAPIVVMWRGLSPVSPLGALPFPPAVMSVVFVLLLTSGALFLLGLVIGMLRNTPSSLAGWVQGAWTVLLAVLILGFAPLFIRSQYGVSATVGQYLSTLPMQPPVLCYSEHASESVVFYARRTVDFYLQHRYEADEQFFQKFTRLRSAVIITDAEGVARLSADANLRVLRTIGPCVIVQATMRDR